MIKLSKAVPVLIALACLSGPASGESWRENYESEDLLAAAVKEFNLLDRDQLEAIIDYIANCRGAPIREREFPCYRAAQVADIKTFQAYSLYKLRRAIDNVNQTIPWESSGPDPRVSKDISRGVAIFSALKDAAIDRYQKLKQKK